LLKSPKFCNCLGIHRTHKHIGSWIVYTSIPDLGFKGNVIAKTGRKNAEGKIPKKPRYTCIIFELVGLYVLVRKYRGDIVCAYADAI